MKGKYYAFFIVWILLTIGLTVAFCAAFMSIWSGGGNPALEDVLPGALALGVIVAFCICSPALCGGSSGGLEL